ncbi:MAG TPA: AAA family ATPase [Isosphaeraceae bacterium]|jgi:predicted ATPase|nr:AAA family ATPase [Isosphaeraceae bacterium]
MLKRMDIRGYRSIKDISLELRSLNVLIGPNGAGKSNFVSFFKMLNEMMGGRLQQYIGTSGRGQSILHFGPKVTPQLEGQLEFEADNCTNCYSMRLFHAAGDTLIFAEEKLAFLRTGYSSPKVVSLGAGHQETRIGEEANKGEKTAWVIRRLLDQCRVYHFHDTSPTARVRQHSYVNDNRWLMPDAGNLAAMLFAYREKSGVVYRRIVSTLRKIMPEFEDFDLGPSRLNPNDIILNWRKPGHDYLFGPHQISDGSLRAMAICTLFLQPEDDLPDVIILDEPELGLHPHALEIVAGLIRAASSRTQVIAATQSQILLNYFEPSEVITVEAHDGQSVFRRLEPEQLKDWLEDYSLGELWQRNVLGGGPLP